MEPKPRPQTGKAEAAKPSAKRAQGATETARLFLDVAQMSRRSLTGPLTRYIE